MLQCHLSCCLFIRGIECKSHVHLAKRLGVYETRIQRNHIHDDTSTIMLKSFSKQ